MPGFVLQAAPVPADLVSDLALPVARVGFTVSRKVGNAVARNRARRRLRAAAALVLTRRAAPGHDYVIVGRAATLTRTFPGLTEDLEAGLRRLGLWRDDAAPAGTEER